MTIEIIGRKSEPDFAEVCNSKGKAVFGRFGKLDAVTGFLGPDRKCFVSHTIWLLYDYRHPVRQGTGALLL